MKISSIGFSLLLLASESVISSKGTAADHIDYNRQIRPLISNRCLACHGPDEGERKAGLRLDTFEGATKDLEGTHAIVPGKSDQSEILTRLLSQDPEERMPPPKKGKPLEPEQIELIRRWIDQGGKFDRHWSYIAPVKAPVPSVKDGKWPINEIDSFLLSRIEKEDLHPSPEADRRTLARRLSLDLTGLPPSWEAVLAFEKDTRLDAYERYVAQLLTQPAFGEYWGQAWLDLARYADSSGYPSDQPREIWGYRDWVISALNRNLPFDQFTIDQIAGDLIPNPSQDQVIATSFHRNTMTQNEGGTSDEEFRIAAVIDRVNTSMSVWMGTTMSCAQCHTHKSDPLTQIEYFSLFDIFNQSADADRKDETPVLSFYTTEQKKERDQLSREISEIEKRLSDPDPAWKDGTHAWAERMSTAPSWQSPAPDRIDTKFESRKAVPDGDGFVRIDKSVQFATYTVELSLPSGPISGLRVETRPLEGFGNFVLSSIQAEILPPSGKADAKPQSVSFVSAKADYEQEGFPATSLLKSGKEKTGWAVAGATDRPHELIFALKGSPSATEGSRLRVVLEQKSTYANHLIGSFRLSVSTSRDFSEWIALPPSISTILKKPLDKRSTDEQRLIVDYYVRHIAPETRPDRELLAAKTAAHDAIRPSTVPVMEDLPAAERRETRVQIRGNWQNLGDVAHAGTPAAFPPLPKGSHPDRLGFARWLVSRENPLTARVTVNRFWESLFGVGIVSTSEEFGSQGEPPFHPELLDWLAVDFMEHGWDVKRLLTQLVSTRAYRQVSRVSPESMERDPENRVLARGPRFRPQGELLRDQALDVAGTLSLKMGGPSVRPMAPNLGLSTAFGRSNDWVVSPGEDRHRRSVYTEVRRNSPYPSFTTFDAPNREVCTIRRNRTNTPLQAFVTLNDPVFVESSQAFARRIVAKVDAPNPETKIRFACHTALSRDPDKKELDTLIRLHAEALSEFRRDAAAAESMATDPLGPADKGADLADLAAWTAVANVVMNLDEFLMRR